MIVGEERTLVFEKKKKENCNRKQYEKRNKKNVLFLCVNKSKSVIHF